MLVRIWRLLTIMLAALTMAAVLAFLVRAPAGVRLDRRGSALPGGRACRLLDMDRSRAILQVAALGFLVLSILVETPPLVTSMKGDRRG
jgi:hypothetical protein